MLDHSMDPLLAPQTKQTSWGLQAAPMNDGAYRANAYHVQTTIPVVTYSVQTTQMEKGNN